jgi:hypothetical protein
VLGKGCLKGCVGKVWLTGLLVVAALAGWRWGPAIFPRMQTRFVGDAELREVVPSPELAEAALDRFTRFRRGEMGSQLSLSATDVVSVIRYSATGLLPDGVSDPDVEFRDGRVTLTARVSVEAFPGLPTLGSVLGFLPDTVSVSVSGALTPLDENRIALVVYSVRAAFIPVPLPDGMIPRILTVLGRRGREGLAEDALAFLIPDGVQSAHVLRDRLILVREGRIPEPS